MQLVIKGAWHCGGWPDGPGGGQAAGLGPHRPLAPATGAWGSGSHPLQLTRKSEQWPGLALALGLARGAGKLFPSRQRGRPAICFLRGRSRRAPSPHLCRAALERARASAGLQSSLLTSQPPSRLHRGPQTGPGPPSPGQAPCDKLPSSRWRVSLFLEGHASRKSLTFHRFTDSGWNAWPSSGPKEKVEGGLGWVGEGLWASIPTRLQACLCSPASTG